MAEDFKTVEQTVKILTESELKKLNEQNSRLVPDIKHMDAKRHWDLFYKRNSTNFFKDRNWTTREFNELMSSEGGVLCQNADERKYMLEMGCGVGNLIFPLIQDGCNHFFYYACDFSPRAVEFVQKNPLYSKDKVNAFQCDVTTKDVFNNIEKESLDIITVIFVLSAIHPDKFKSVVENMFQLLKPGGLVLFRDYGLYDMAQLRFKAGHKISENLYMRQDGTRSYYFSDTEIGCLFEKCGFSVVSNEYIHRRTVNPKENIDVGRIFVQGKFMKPKW